MSPIKQNAIANQAYVDASKHTKASLTQFIQNYNKATLYATTVSGNDVIIDMRNINLNMLTITDAKTNEPYDEFTTVDDTIKMLLKQKTECPEITNGVSSVFLDTDNLAYHLLEAKALQKKYGTNKIEGLTFTGDAYLERIENMIQVANDIMSGTLVPDIFDRIPIKKDKTFQENRVIPIFTNGLIEAANYIDYVEKNELVLCIVPHGTWTYTKHFDLSERTSSNRARMCINCIQGAKKIVPLIAKDMSLNDIVTKASYLKDDDVLQGHIYKEKSGSEYLYLGDIALISETTKTARGKYVPHFDTKHSYIRVTKKIQTLINKSQSLNGFIKCYAESKIKSTYDDLGLSTRTNPRKFVEETAAPFKETTYAFANSKETKPTSLKPSFSIKAVDPYKGNERIDLNYYIIQ